MSVETSESRGQGKNILREYTERSMRHVPSKRDDGISSYVGIPDRISRERRKRKRKKREKGKKEKKRGKNGEEHDTHVEHRHLHTTIRSFFPAPMIRMKECLSTEWGEGGEEGGGRRDRDPRECLKSGNKSARLPPPSLSLRIPITLRYRIRQIDTEEKRFD